MCGRQYGEGWRSYFGKLVEADTQNSDGNRSAQLQRWEKESQPPAGRPVLLGALRHLRAPTARFQGDIGFASAWKRLRLVWGSSTEEAPRAWPSAALWHWQWPANRLVAVGARQLLLKISAILALPLTWSPCKGSSTALEKLKTTLDQRGKLNVFRLRPKLPKKEATSNSAWCQNKKKTKEVRSNY